MHFKFNSFLMSRWWVGTCFCTLTCPYPITHLPNGSGYFRAKPFPIWYPQHFSNLVHSTHTYPPTKVEQTVCSETSAYKRQTPGNYPEESIQRMSVSIEVTGLRTYYTGQTQNFSSHTCIRHTIHHISWYNIRGCIENNVKSNKRLTWF